MWIAFIDAQNRYERLKGKAEKNPIIQFDTQDFVNNAENKHNYTMFITFSTDDKNLQCALCSPVNEAFKELARHYRDSLGPQRYDSEAFRKNPIFFVNCDIMKCKEIVMGNNWKELPKLLYLAPSEVKTKTFPVEEFPNLVVDYSPESLSRFVYERTHYEPILILPSWFTNIGYYGFYAVGLIIVVVYVLPVIYQRAKDPLFWFGACILVYGIVMSGPVFNAINKPPFSYRHPYSGQTFFVYPNPRQQFVGEGLMMGAIFSACAVSITGLVAFVPRVKDPWRQRVLFGAFLVTSYMSYRGLLQVFKAKYGYYPFA